MIVMGSRRKKPSLFVCASSMPRAMHVIWTLGTWKSVALSLLHAIMLHLLFFAFSNKDLSAQTGDFPLEAYTRAGTVAHTPQIQAKPTRGTPRAAVEVSRPQRGIGRALTSFFTVAGLFIKLWMIVLVATDLSRRMCFSGHGVLLPNAICDNLAPSTSQFLRHFFNEHTSDSRRLISSQGIDFYTRLLQQYIQHPPRPLEPDFALRGAGASIIGDLTSPSLRLPRSYFHAQNPDFNHPSIILEEATNVGDCWEFEGSKGWVGVRLSEKVDINAMTVHYVNPTILPSNMATKAPHTMTLWALSDTKAAENFSTTANINWRSPKQFATKFKIPEMIPTDYVFLPIIHANFSLDAWPMPTNQRFSVGAHDTKGQTVRSDMVVIEVTSNWGTGSTCLHHIAIHGQQ